MNMYTPNVDAALMHTLYGPILAAKKQKWCAEPALMWSALGCPIKSDGPQQPSFWLVVWTGQHVPHTLLPGMGHAPGCCVNML